ncbi:MAG: 7-cyano-7-deazaguanine synthase QueC [Fimbriimonadaceae bacterium]
MPSCVVLLSGGLDSATCLAIAKSLGFDVHALTVSYGQRHQAELRAAERVAKAMAVTDHRHLSVNLDAFGGSALTADIDVPKNRDEGAMAASIPATYVPARNTVFLGLALGHAEVIGAEDIFIGVNAVDYSGYPDCRPEFIQAFEHLAAVATKIGIEGHGPTIHVPLISLTKPEIIRRGLALGVDYGLTHSCYDPGPDDAPCQACDACVIRMRAFEALGMRDPALK